jgi:hypothetical protein
MEMIVRGHQAERPVFWHMGIEANLIKTDNWIARFTEQLQVQVYLSTNK